MKSYIPKTLTTLLVCQLAIFFCLSNAFGNAATPAQKELAHKILFHGVFTGNDLSIDDGEHEFHVHLYSKDDGLVHDETLKAEVRQGRYDLILGTVTPLIANLKDLKDIGIAVDNGKELRSPAAFSPYTSLSEEMLDATMVRIENKLMTPIEPYTISAQTAERLAYQNGTLILPVTPLMPMFSRMESPIHGLSMEMSLAAPDLPTMDAYEMAKYGRVSAEYDNFIPFNGTEVGLAAQAMHVAHHMLFYSAGFTTDVNHDGMFMLTLGSAYYQTGNAATEPFVNAPFMRIRYKSSQDMIFAYSELETTVHYRSYLSGTLGMGLRVTPDVSLIGGYHHTEFLMPNDHMTRMVDGFHGIISLAM